MPVKKLNIAIITGSDFKSPRMLAESLSPMIVEAGHLPEIFYRVKALRRLNTSGEAGQTKMTWFLHRLLNLPGDRYFFRKLRRFDLIIVCGCVPYAFYRESYNIRRLKEKVTGVPVMFYAVQFLGNAPTLIERLKSGGHELFDRYDWHLSVSDVTEIRGMPSSPWSHIGLNLKSSGLKPTEKEKFLAIVDFPQPGHEQYREMHIRVLRDLKVDYIALEGYMTSEQIRDVYRKASALFIQSKEAFGLPIAECLACGAYIFTAETSWPMSWRLDKEPVAHGPGVLPDCFVVYNDEETLRAKLDEKVKNFDRVKTPLTVFDSFYKSYPFFYDGNIGSLAEAIDKVSRGGRKQEKES